MHKPAQHVELYRERGRYAGWPANYGIWSWQEEIVVGFTLGFYDENNGGFHTADRSVVEHLAFQLKQDLGIPLGA